MRAGHAKLALSISPLPGKSLGPEWKLRARFKLTIIITSNKKRSTSIILSQKIQNMASVNEGTIVECERHIAYLRTVINSRRTIENRSELVSRN